MGNKPSVFAIERAQIVSLHIKRLSKRQIAKSLQCSKSAVHCAIKKLKKHENL